MDEESAIAQLQAGAGAASAGLAGTAYPARPLRERIVASVCDRDGGADAADLEEFLDTADTADMLRRWFGVGALRAMSPRDARFLRLRIDRDIAALDTLLSEQLDAILHHREFKQLEATWRGVSFLLDQVEEDDKVIIRLLTTTWKELGRDFDRSSEFDQSALFTKVYSEEFGTPGGLPYGLLLCDHSVRHRHGGADSSDDIGTLSRLGEVAAAAFAPCVVGAAPELFGVSTFAELSHVQHIDAGFRLAEYQRWRRLQEKEESRFLGVVLPRILLRGLHDRNRQEREGFVYSERALGIDDWLWGNAVYGFGAVVIRAFRESGWFADIRGARDGVFGAGRVDGLPTPLFSSGEAVAYRRPLEVELTDRKQRVLEELGGGFDTTTALTAHSLEWLSEHPEERELLSNNRDTLLDPATEEFLRYFTPAAGDGRTFSGDVELNGNKFKEGERLWISWAMANRDPSVFADPDKVDLDRKGNRHFSFGIGVHRCVGSNVARTVFKSMLTAVLDRMPDFHCDLEGAVHYECIGVIQGMRNLPATFTPGPTVGAGLDETLDKLQRICDEQQLALPITERKEAAVID